MRILGLLKLNEFCGKHKDSKDWIENWIADVGYSKWKRPQDIKDRYPSASFLANRVIIFNVKGNHYRLEVQVAFNTQTVLVRWIGTHADYDRRNG